MNCDFSGADTITLWHDAVNCWRIYKLITHKWQLQFEDQIKCEKFKETYTHFVSKWWGKPDKDNGGEIQKIQLRRKPPMKMKLYESKLENP